MKKIAQGATGGERKMKPITRRQFLQAAAAAGILGSAAVAGAAPEQAVNWFYRNRLGTLYCHEGDWS